MISFPHAQVLLVATTFVCKSEAKPGGGSHPVGECMPSCRKLLLCVTSRTVPCSVSISAHRLCFLASALGVMLMPSCGAIFFLTARNYLVHVTPGPDPMWHEILSRASCPSGSPSTISWVILAASLAMCLLLMITGGSYLPCPKAFLAMSSLLIPCTVCPTRMMSWVEDGIQSLGVAIRPKMTESTLYVNGQKVL